MTKIDIISGFLGAGKTTLIKKLIEEVYAGEKLVLIENEFGEIGIDGGFLKDAGIEITEMNSGCICCSLVGDFGEALGKVLDQFHPDRVVIEPSGVGKLSDVIKAVQRVEHEHEDEMVLGSFVTVADATKARVYMKNFGEFYNDQVAAAGAIILSRTQGMDDEKLAKAVALLKEKNPDAPVITTPWDVLTGAQIMEAMEGVSLAQKLMEEEECCCGHHHHHEEGECCCGHHHHNEDEEHECCGHHHHDEDEEHECCGHDHEHHHDHHHDHEHHHHADEVFTSWGKETVNKYSEDQLQQILKALDSLEYGTVLRAKGIVMADDGEWFHYDYVPGEVSIRKGSADYTGRICVIGSDLDEEGLAKLFKL